MILNTIATSLPFKQSLLRLASSNFIKTAFIYSGTNVFAQGAMVLQGIITRRLLPPALMGYWNFCSVAMSFSLSLTLNILCAVRRELPILRGAGKTEDVESCQSVTLVYSLFEIGLISIGILGYAFLKKSTIPHWQFAALLIAAFLVITTRIQENYTIFFQGHQRFIPLSRLLIINHFIYAFTIPVATFLGGVWGLFIGVIIAEIIKASLLCINGYFQNIRPKFRWNTTVFKGLLSYSVLFRLTDYPFTLMMMIDSLWITKFMTIKELGIYSFAKSIHSQALDITTRFGTVFFARFLQKFGQSKNNEALQSDSYRFVHFQLLVCLPLLNWGIFTVFPLVIRQVTPLYTACIPPLLILLSANFFNPNNNLLYSKWLAERRLFAYGTPNLIGLTVTILSLSSFHFFLRMGTLLNVSISICLGYLANFIYLCLTAGKETFGLKQATYFILKTISSSAYSYWILYRLLGNPTISLSLAQDVIITLKNACISLLLLLPILAIHLKQSFQKEPT